MGYQEFIDGINNGTIQKVSFSVKGYAHYRNCMMISKSSTNSYGKLIGRLIWFYLTPDCSEKQGFLNNVDEKKKIFYIKGKGSFTLKQIWSHIIINSIE